LEILNYPECKAWLSDRNVTQSCLAEIERSGWKMSVPTPTDSGQKIALSRFIVDSLFSSKSALLVVAVQGVWPSAELPFVFEKYRDKQPNTRMLDDYPGTLTSNREVQDLLVLTALGLLFFWDIYIFSEDLSSFFTSSHDEWHAGGKLTLAGDQYVLNSIFTETT
jgi:hypothetical protein